jgi:hypothetical protein
MLAYQDLLNISPYEELFKDQQAKGQPSKVGLQDVAAKEDQSRGNAMMLFKAIAQFADMFNPDKAKKTTSASDSVEDYGGPNGPYGGSDNTGWTGIAPKAW